MRLSLHVAGVVAAMLAAFVGAVAACSTSDVTDTNDSAPTRADASTLDRTSALTTDAESVPSAEASTAIDAAPPCTTRISYGADWVAPTNHPNSYDDVSGLVTWDGTCTTDGADSYAVLSNGFKPYFTGHDACILALDQSGACATPPPACTTRVTYGSTWLPPASHPNAYDDVKGRIFSDGTCHNLTNQSYAVLSNGWQPNFTGNDACGLSFRYTQCGGLYTNPVIPTDCPDPGVLFDNGTYYLSCTSGDAADAFPIYTSSDLVSWKVVGHIFPAASKPTWGKSDYWAPEIHRIGSSYVAYFSARNTDGMLSIGAASAPTPLGPFSDIGAPLIHDPNMGLIDASEITANGVAYVLWKEDGNAVGKPTPIHAQALDAAGLALTGAASTLISNDQTWEGAVTEGPWMVEHDGSFYLFYSGNSYANATYAVGVAKASAPTGPFTKAAGPILVSGGAWAGPGHCSVLDTPAGDTVIVYHSWESTAVNAAPGRLTLVDQIAWDADGGMPSVELAPSSTTRPIP